MCTTAEQGPAVTGSAGAGLPVPGTAAEALEYARAGLGFLATAGAAGLTAGEHADLLRGLAAAE